MVFAVDFPSFSIPGQPPPDLELFRHQHDRRQKETLMNSLEYRVAAEVAAANFKETPTEPVWQWAAREVWLDAKMAAQEGFYDPDMTPWMKEIQELPLRHDVRECVIKKPSRSGGTEAAFNILRWMPENWPGNAGVVFPEDKQGRDVTKRRLLSSIQKAASAQLSPDEHDTGLSNIHLLNMTIKMGPSGSARMFTEWWVRYFILDELEEHDQTDSTTTYERALSRQTDVADSLLIAISKPKKAGGPIDRYFIRGSQKDWKVQCPRCEGHFVLARDHFRNDPDCRNPDGTWNLEMVEKNTYAVCPLCQGRIDEHEKRLMNDGALWVPRDPQHRRRGLDGKYVPPVPGVESYQLSDYVSYHPKVTWGKLRVMYLVAFEIQPSHEAKTHYINNHEGECEEPDIVSTDADTIAKLVAGRVETRRIKNPDGTEIEQTETHGIPGGYRLAYRHGVFSAPLPFTPTQVVIFIDKQLGYLKYSVWSVRVGASLPGQCEAHLLDLGREDDESTLRDNVITRSYPVVGEALPMKITAGFFDSRYRGQAVYKFCLQCYHELGLQIWPVRGEGEKEAFGRQRDASPDKRSKDTARGRMLRYVDDICDLGTLKVRYFKDHPLQHELNDKLTRAPGWRLWLPHDYPAEFAAELTAEKYDQTTDTWIHNKQKFGPNDWRDTTKYLVLWLLEHLNPLLEAHGITASSAPPPPDEEEKPEYPHSREYVLKANAEAIHGEKGSTK
jgi:phage terminase large subunit GpA-like protein